MNIEIRRAELDDLEALVGLFEAYRSFYEHKADRRGAKGFLHDRLQERDSVLFVALRGDSGLLGFVQLYPSFSSTAMRRIFILNDLFVAAKARKAGIGQALMEAAKEHARGAGAVRLSLSTAVDNAVAQRLYEANGYVRDRAFSQYHLQL